MAHGRKSLRPLPPFFVCSVPRHAPAPAYGEQQITAAWKRTEDGVAAVVGDGAGRTTGTGALEHL